MGTNDTNRFLNVLGSPGKYAWVIFAILCCNYIPVAFNHLVMSMYGAVPKHRCRLPEDVPLDNNSIPDGDSCNVYANYSAATGQKVKCPDGWVYTLNGRESMIVNEWDLVCDDRYLSSLATTIYFVGVMVGGLLCGPLADITGRRPMMIVTMYTPVLIGIMVYLVKSIYLFMLLRFCIGVCIQGVQITTYVIASELCSTSKTRAYATAIFECYWATGVMILSGIAYFGQNWRWIQLGITLPTLLTLLWVWALPESFRFLLLKKRYKPSMAYLKTAAKFNKVEITEDIEQDLKDLCSQKKEGVEEKKYTLWHAFKTPNLRKHTLIMFYIWLATSLGYYGLSLQASRFTGDKYLNFFISGAIELPAYVAGIWILSIIGRRYPLCFYFLSGGVACILAGVVPKETGSGADIAWVSTMLAWIGKFSLAGCWSVLFLYSSEVFPTVIRNSGVGACAFWARVGGVIAPQINLIAEYSYSWIPVVIFGIAAIIGGLLSLLLPETRDLHFPDTLEEAEALGKKTRDVQGQDNPALAPDVEKDPIPGTRL